MTSDPTASPPRWAPDDALFGHCRLGLEDFEHAVRREPRTRQLVALAMALGAAGVALGAWLIATAHGRSGSVAVGLGLACFAAYNVPDQIARRWFTRTPPAARLVKYTLGAQGLIITSEASRELHEWTQLQGYHELPNSFLIWVSAKLFLVVPKRAFASADLARVTEQLERRLGAPPALPRFWSGLALAVLVALLALGLWNRLSPR
jgi:hypothetical protein